MPGTELSAAYCGPPPTAETLWGRWNFDPALLAILALCAIGFFVTQRHRSARQHLSFAAAFGTLCLIFISPLCALTVALFSARVAHHVLLVAVAAPFLAVALPMRAGGLLAPILALSTLVFWLWHIPDVYSWALASTAGYWLMQLSLLACSYLLWGAVFSANRGKSIVALLGTTIQMGLLGALLVFAGQPLYAPHFATTLAFGLDPLTDQQLAGLIMWVPASLPYLAVALYQLLTWLRPATARQN